MKGKVFPMKKNILTIIILATTLINMTLMIVMLFVFLPNVKQTNNLITKVAQTVDLELENVVVKEDKVSISDIEPYKPTDASGLTINLKKEPGDNKTHYAAVKWSLVLNKNHKDFSKMNPLVEANEGRIKEIIRTEVEKYTINTVNKETIKDDVLKILQDDVFGSDFIISVSFSDFVTE
jgi:flagellar FliL protein